MDTARDRTAGPLPHRPALWKVLGLAGLAGVAATGVVVAREQRRRQQLTPDQVRQRLHARFAESTPPASSPSPPEN